MMIGSRQMKFDCANVPPIKYSEKINIVGYESIVNVFTEAILKKMCQAYRDSKENKKKYPHIQEMIDKNRAEFKNCIEQTIHFLNYIKAINPKKITSIVLWKEAVKMHPFFEGINCSLKSMLIEKHNPVAASEMNKGAVWASYNLDKISEAVLYIMEFFQKEKLFNKVEDIIKTKEVEKWIVEYNKYVIKNKDKIIQENKEREEHRKNDIESIDKKLNDLKNGLGEK